MHKSPARRWGGRQRLVGSAAVIAVLVCVRIVLPLVAGPHNSSSARRHVGTKHPLRLVYQDNFNGPDGSGLGAEWSFHTGAGSGIGLYAAGRAVAHVNGHGELVLTARHVGNYWQTVQIESSQGFMPPYGSSLVVESRISMPVAYGYWPAFWMVPQDAFTDPHSEPMAGELDIAETIDTAKWVSQTLHCGQAKNSGACAATLRPRFFVYDFYRFKTIAGKHGWYTYAMLWHNQGMRSFISFYVNGALQVTVTAHEVGAKYWDLAFEHPYHLIYDVAVGGYAGPPNRTSPRSASMRVKYIRVYVAHGLKKL